MSALDLTVLILTFNEEKHLARCIRSVKTLAARVVVVDSKSCDRTEELAKELGASFYQNPWTNHATQVNWALENTSISTRWVFRLDADEVVAPELEDALARRLPFVDEGTAGLTVNRRIYFLGRWIRHGGVYPSRTLRVFRFGKGRSEQRWMDEHIVVSGSIAHVDADICDINLNSVNWWTTKHNDYAMREAIDAIQSSIRGYPDPELTMSAQARRRRWIKEHVYYRLPLGVRPVLYFVYRYFLRLGFLDGWPGLAFHTLQGFWYRFLVDANIYEIKSAMRKDGLSLPEAVARRYGKII